jgi:hypothetical protein
MATMANDVWTRVRERIQQNYKYTGDADGLVKLFRDPTINCDLVCDVADIIGIGSTCKKTNSRQQRVKNGDVYCVRRWKRPHAKRERKDKNKNKNNVALYYRGKRPV